MNIEHDLNRKEKQRIFKPEWFVLLLVLFLISVIVVSYYIRKPEPVKLGWEFGPEKDIHFLRRKDMIAIQVLMRDITDQRIIDAMGKIRRQEFMPPEKWDHAYSAGPISIGYDRRISAPHITAVMVQSLELKETDKVLEICTGSGYQTALLAEIAKEVYSVENIKELAENAKQALKKEGYRNVYVKNADCYYGLEDFARYDAIIVNCATEYIPTPLIKQLADGGRLVIPLGDVMYIQALTLIRKTGDSLDMKKLKDVKFVPMTGDIQIRKE